MVYSFTYETNIGLITISESNSNICRLEFGLSTNTDAHIQETPLLIEANKQLNEYFSASRKTFSLPLNPSGTDFQKKVWKTLLTIPYGESRSYKDIALLIENPKAYRAIGMANNKNPISIFIPCHRVIGANGKLVGYGGGLAIKKYLLELEQNNP